MEKSRYQIIFRAGIVAICVNVALGIFKAIVGVLSHSVAITMDAVNNFTDAGSSFITIISAHFSAKPADKKHPFGYGRTEYLGTLLIGGLILYAGVTALIESVKKIFVPEAADYSTVMLFIVAVAIFAKLALTLYTVRVGKKTNSDSMIASGKEAMADVAISIATLVAALIYVFTNFSIESYLAALIALVIIKSGVETLKETVGKILGTGAEVSLVQDIKKTIAAHEEVNGAYDLVLHDYGQDSYIGSVHVEVADTMSMEELDRLTRTIQDEIAEKYHFYLSTVGIYCANTVNEEKKAIKAQVRDLVLQDPLVHQLHGFYVNLEEKVMSFDLVVSFDSENREKTFEEALSKVREKFPEYRLNAGMDCDFNEC